MKLLIDILACLADLAFSHDTAAQHDVDRQLAAGPKRDLALDYALGGLDPTGDPRVDYNLYEEYTRQLKS